MVLPAMFGIRLDSEYVVKQSTIWNIADSRTLLRSMRRRIWSFVSRTCTEYKYKGEKKTNLASIPGVRVLIRRTRE